MRTHETPSVNTEAELQQYEGPTPDFSILMDMQSPRRRRTQHENISSEDEVEESNPDYVPRHAKRDEAVEVEEASGTSEDEPQVLNRRVIQSGERSKISKLEMSNGQEYTETDSEYIDITHDFKEAHQELMDEDNFNLNLEMTGLSTDLAFIDATRGGCYEKADDAHRAALLEDYSKLRARLEDPATPDQHKQLIRELFQKLSGRPLDFLTEEYERGKVLEKQSEQIGPEIEKEKGKIEKKAEELTEFSRYFEDALARMKELIANPDTNLDRYLGNLEQAQARLKQYAGQYDDLSNTLSNAVDSFQDFINDTRHLTNEQIVADNTDFANAHAKLAKEAHKKAEDVQNYIYYEVNRFTNKMKDLYEKQRRRYT